MVRRRKPSQGIKPDSIGKSKGPRAHGHTTTQKDHLYDDEEDLFHQGRDEILLDGSDAIRTGDLEDYDDQEEVFALKGLDEESDLEDEDEYDSEDDPDHDDGDSSGDSEVSDPLKKPSVKSKSVKPTPKKVAEEDEEEEGEERWGKKKSAYYSSAAQEMDSDDEEAMAMEEAEALRLQTKSRDALVEDDFGFDDLLQALPSTSTPSTSIASAPTPLLKGPRLPQSLIRDLERTNPEVLALARELDDMSILIRKVGEAIQERTAKNPNHSSLGVVHLHHQTLITYATVLTHYFYIRATPVPGPTPNAPSTAREVPPRILERLFQLKQALSLLEDYGFSILGDGDGEVPQSQSQSESEEEEEDDDDEEDLGSDEYEYDEEEDMANVVGNGILSAEAEMILAELEYQRRDESVQNQKRAQKLNKVKEKKTNGRDAGNFASASAPTEPSSPKTSKATKKAKASKADKLDSSSSSNSTQKPFTFDLVEPEFGSSSKSLQKDHPSSSSSTFDPYGEATSLSTLDSLEKSATQKSLRFHTNKIETASRRRQAARAQAMGGDDDIPMRGFGKKEREQRKTEEAKQKGLSRGDDLDDLDPEVNVGKGKKRAREEDGEDDELARAGAGAENEDGVQEDGYYELVKNAKKKAKIEKKAAYEAKVAANKPDFNDPSTSGPRSANHAILKNKGMTPRRSKTVRNPRVKKKLRFEQAKKKVGSKKAVFKGGIASLPGGRYEGEKTGISNVVKSVKL